MDGLVVCVYFYFFVVSQVVQFSFVVLFDVDFVDVFCVVVVVGIFVWVVCYVGLVVGIVYVVDVVQVVFGNLVDVVDYV